MTCQSGRRRASRPRRQGSPSYSRRSTAAGPGAGPWPGRKAAARHRPAACASTVWRRAASSLAVFCASVAAGQPPRTATVNAIASPARASAPVHSHNVATPIRRSAPKVPEDFRKFNQLFHRKRHAARLLSHPMRAAVSRDLRERLPMLGDEGTKQHPDRRGQRPQHEAVARCPRGPRLRHRSRPITAGRRSNWPRADGRT